MLYRKDINIKKYIGTQEENRQNIGTNKKIGKT